VNLFCTCGAKLPDEARFCHKCGKPQFEEPPPIPEDTTDLRELALANEVRAAAEATLGAAAMGPAPISFHNGHAVRTAFLSALLVWMLMIVPIGGPIGILFRLFILLAGGFVSVYFYNKRTGETLTVTAGARMGWITGVVFYVIWMVFFTITLILLQSEGGLLKAYQEQLKESAAPQAGVEQLMEIMKSPEMFATMLVVTLGVVFFVFTLSMIAGGALAAKILPRD
jgi:hypothetical protein